MPNNVRFSNGEALRRGFERAKWKQDLTLEYFKNANYRKEIGFGFDFRDMYSVIPLIIDISGVWDRSEEEKKEYFISELKKIEAAFITPGPIKGMPDPARVKPYIRQMYDTMLTEEDSIDWDDEAAIDNMFCSMITTQAIGTMVEKFPKEIIELYPTKEEIKELDVISTRSYFTSEKLRNALAVFDVDLLDNLGIGSQRTELLATQLDADVVLAFTDATMNGSDVAIIDLEKSEVAKKFFLGNAFSINDIAIDPSEPAGKYTDNDAARHYLESITRTSTKSCVEYMAVKAVQNDESYTDASFLFINGKPVQELIDEKVNNENMRGIYARIAVGKMIRDAMTDGKSVVSLMRPVITAEGKASFTHQEIKVDLDELNRIERHENHNAFRRFLDYIGLWKLQPKFATNDNRDARQAEEKNKPEYKAALRAAEERFVKTYNEVALKKTTDRLLSSIPHITLEENANENQVEAVEEIEQVRENIVVNEAVEEEKKAPLEPIAEEEEFSLVIEEDEKSLNV